MDFKQLKAIGSLVRLPNLLIIVGTLVLMDYKTGIEGNLSSFLILLIGTTLIAAAGNVVNDIYDVTIDVVNKPQKVIIGRFISLKNAWNLYWVLNSSALIAAIYSERIELGIFFLIAILLLYFYSYQWKRKMLIGNLVVAFLCALVVIEYWWITRVNLTNYWHKIILSYAGFAFLSTLAREMIKDIEDVDGDRVAGCQTLVIQLGEDLTKRIVIGIFGGLLIVLFLEAFFFYQNVQKLPFIYTITILIIFLFYLMFKTFGANKKDDYTVLSKSLKRYMLLGLILLLLA